MVELQFVVLAVAGSSPVGRPPPSFTSEEGFNGMLWCQIGASCYDFWSAPECKVLLANQRLEHPF